MIGLKGIGSMGIGLAVVMDDQFSKVSAGIRAELGLLDGKTSDFTKGMARLQSFGSAMQNVGDTIIRVGAAAYKKYAEFDDVVNSTRAIIGGMARNSVEYEQLGDQARKLAVDWGLVANEVGGAQLELAKAGKTADQVKAMTEAVVVLASASESSVNGARGTAVMLSDIMNIYGASSDKAMYFANILTSAANRSTIDVTDFYESLRYSADIAKQLKIPVEETAAVIAAMGNAGMKGSMGGVAYANMLRYLSKALSPFASKKQTTALNMLGITPAMLRTAKGTMKPMTEILNIFRQHAKGLSPIDLQNTLGQIFNVRGNRGFEPLLNGFADATGKMGDYEAMLQLINKDIKENVALTTAKEKIDDPMFNIKQFKSAWTDLQIEIGKSLGPALKPFFEMATSLLIKLKSLFQSDFGKWLLRATFILGGVGLALIGRVIVAGARFMAYMVTSAGTLTAAWKTGIAASAAIRNNLMAGADALVVAGLRSQGVASITSRVTGATMLRNRGANGRFISSVPANFFSKTMGLVGVAAGVRMYGNLAAAAATGTGIVGKVLGFIGKLATPARLLGTVLGKVGSVLFGWPMLLLDLASSLITGKGIFEWVWQFIKSIFGMGNDDEVKKEKKILKFDSSVSSSNGSQNDATMDRMNKAGMIKIDPTLFKDRTQTINITVNSNGEFVTKKINLNKERDLNNISL